MIIGSLIRDMMVMLLVAMVLEDKTLDVFCLWCRGV